MQIKEFFEPKTSTFSYVVSDIDTDTALIIDSVLDYDQYSGRTSTQFADSIIQYIADNDLHVKWILETHIHADHLTAARYLKEKLGGEIGIGSKVKDVLKFWVPKFNIGHDTDINGSQFDILLDEKTVLDLGNIKIRVLETPGHTPACVSYHIENVIFTGDTIFMPDVGTARTDFPGGSAQSLYNSIQKILALEDTTRIFVGHDYPPQDRESKSNSTVAVQKVRNIMINDNITQKQYVTMRNKKDENREVPKLLLPSIQFNLRAGSFGTAEDNQIRYIKIPVDTI